MRDLAGLNYGVLVLENVMKGMSTEAASPLWAYTGINFSDMLLNRLQGVGFLQLIPAGQV